MASSLLNITILIRRPLDKPKRVKRSWKLLRSRNLLLMLWLTIIKLLVHFQMKRISLEIVLEASSSFPRVRPKSLTRFFLLKSQLKKFIKIVSPTRNSWKTFWEKIQPLEYLAYSFKPKDMILECTSKMKTLSIRGQVSSLHQVAFCFNQKSNPFLCCIINTLWHLKSIWVAMTLSQLSAVSPSCITTLKDSSKTTCVSSQIDVLILPESLTSPQILPTKSFCESINEDKRGWMNYKFKPRWSSLKITCYNENYLDSKLTRFICLLSLSIIIFN